MPKPLCGKNFTNPIKVENVGSGAVYEARPYCLTEITVEKEVLISALEPKIPAEENKVGGKPLTEGKREIQAIPEKTECKHYFGYLSKRSFKRRCPRRVYCMRKDGAVHA